MKEWPDNVVNRLKCWWDNRETRCGETHANCRDCPFHVPGYSMQDAVKDAIGWFYRFEAAQPKWISVVERLPEPNRKVLTIRKECSGTGRYRYALDHTILWIDGTLVWGVDMETWKGRVTHWMPLPEAPKEANNA